MIATHEREGRSNELAGRVVNWLQTPETTGCKYNSVCIVTYDAYARAKPAHSHADGEETIYVLTGTGKVKVGDDVYPLEPGSLVLFPQGIPHMVYNTSDEPMKLVCFYGPDQEAISYTYHEDFDFAEFC